MANPRKKYGLYILKRDADHITLIETENFDEAHELWKETKTKWATSMKEQIPFELTKPIITAFDPGLIYEITVRPVPEALANANTDNPYVQKMQRDGFGNTLGNRGDMLDSGFKY